MSTYKNLKTLVARLRDDLNNPTKQISLVLIYAYNRTGKTRLSMEFKDAGKRKTQKNPAGTPDTLYFNAFTEDLFVWENDLEGDSVRRLQLNEKSSFFNAMTELALDETIAQYLFRYADFEFDFTYKEVPAKSGTVSKPDFVSFRKGGKANIKVSRGEQNIFIWCVFMAICERMLDGHESYQGKKYLYIDDPISSLDDNNAISVACDLAKLLRRAATRKDGTGAPAPIKVIFSSHHALFFNVMCNEVRRRIEGEPKVTHKRYFLHRPGGDGAYTLQATDDTPFFHHVATLAELLRAADPAKGKLYTFHFNALRSVMEKTASFFGQRQHVSRHNSVQFCRRAMREKSNFQNSPIRIPAEWEPHECCWMSWAVDPVWSRPDTTKIRDALSRIAHTIARYEPVRMLAPPGPLLRAAQQEFNGCANINVLDAPVSDFWMRDIMPTFAFRSLGAKREVVAIDWHFNGWGRVPPHSAVAGSGLAESAAVIFGVPRIEASFVAEGGALVTDGNGTMIVTRSCLLNSNRNPLRAGIDRQTEISSGLSELGVRKVIWLEGDPCEPITSGHADGYVLCAPNNVILVEAVDDPEVDSPFWREHDIALLENARNTDDFPFTIHRINSPRERYCRGDPEYFAASYANAYIANGAVIAARFGDAERDELARQALAKAFPERDIIMLQIDAIANGGGGVHCVTQQMPRLI